MNSCPWLSHVIRGIWENACFSQRVRTNMLFKEFLPHICRRPNIEPRWNPHMFILSVCGESWILISIINWNCKVVGIWAWTDGIVVSTRHSWLKDQVHVETIGSFDVSWQKLNPPHDLFAFDCTNFGSTSKVMLVHSYILWILKEILYKWTHIHVKLD